MRDSRPTTTDVRKRLSCIYDRPQPTGELTNDVAKLQKSWEWAKKKAEKFASIGISLLFVYMSARARDDAAGRGFR